MADKNSMAGHPPAGQGRLAQLIATRDGQASPEASFDLWSYDDVRTHAADIARRLHDGTMPRDGAWYAARIEFFQRWTDTGLRP